MRAVNPAFAVRTKGEDRIVDQFAFHRIDMRTAIGTFRDIS